jgi:hypothetical protein
MTMDPPVGPAGTLLAVNQNAKRPRPIPIEFSAQGVCRFQYFRMRSVGRRTQGEVVECGGPWNGPVS